jgi:hypothetical protein
MIRRRTVEILRARPRRHAPEVEHFDVAELELATEREAVAAHDPRPFATLADVVAIFREAQRCRQ